MRALTWLIAPFLACCSPVSEDTATDTGSTAAPEPPPAPGFDPCIQVGDGCDPQVGCHPRLVCAPSEASWWPMVCAAPCAGDGTCDEGTCEGGVCLDKQGLPAGHCDGGEPGLEAGG